MRPAPIGRSGEAKEKAFSGVTDRAPQEFTAQWDVLSERFFSIFRKTERKVLQMLAFRRVQNNTSDMEDQQDTSEGRGREEIANEEERKRRWREMLGIDPPPWLDETLAPPIDADADAILSAFARRQLSVEERDRIESLILSFRSWSRAWLRISLQESSQNRRDTE